MNTSVAARTSFALLLLAGGARLASAQCTPISSLPYNIVSPGEYCLTKSLQSSSASGVLIYSGSVTLDLGGFTIAGAPSSTSGAGIYAYEQSSITIRNGVVRGFDRGIDLNGVVGGSSRNHLVENVKVTYSQWTGIHVTGRNSIVRRCQIVTAGGTTLHGTNPLISGILLEGSELHVLDNDVLDFSGTYRIGISLNPAYNTLVEGNRISDTNYGILISGGEAVVVVGNRIFGTGQGVNYSGATGYYRDNITAGVTSKYLGSGTNLGNND